MNVIVGPGLTCIVKHDSPQEINRRDMYLKNEWIGSLVGSGSISVLS